MEQAIKNHRVILPVISFVSGAVLTLAFAPYNLWIIGFLSPAVLFFLWFATDPRQAFIQGYLYGLGMFGLGVNWLHISINQFGGVNLFGAILVTLILISFLAIYPALTGYICRKYCNSNHVINLLVLIPCVWTLMEWCRSWIFTGFPWLNLGYSQTDSWFAGFAPLFGIYGISWLVGICAALIAGIFLVQKRKKLILVCALIFIITVSLFINKIDWTLADTITKSVALVQAAISQEQKWKPEVQQHTIDLYNSLSDPYWGSDIIIWPETAIPMFYHQATSLIESLHSRAVKHGTAMMTGVPVMDTEDRKYFNSIVTLGNKNEIYHKRHLVPFGEYLPFDQLVRPLLDLFGIPMSSFSPGTGRPVLHVAGIPVGVSICYEDAFGEEIIDALPEARLLVNISNDAWFGDSIAPHQHLQIARMRAVETGRYLLRSTNTGISAIIDEKGRVIAQSPQFIPHVLQGNIRGFSGSTPYSTFGNYMILFLLLVVLAFYYLVYKKNPVTG